jgi:hydroxypyruvate reductase
LTGEARSAAQFLLAIGKEVRARSLPIAPPACLLFGGETTVTVRGKGRGGRNQELALAFLAEASRSPKETEGICLLSASTDGIDGPTDAAGAFADMASLSGGREAGLDLEALLDDNDSNRYFEMTKALIKTGPTGTNVCDMQILLIE